MAAGDMRHILQLLQTKNNNKIQGEGSKDEGFIIWDASHPGKQMKV